MLAIAPTTAARVCKRLFQHRIGIRAVPKTQDTRDEIRSSVTGDHALRAARSLRYSSIVKLRNIDNDESSICTKPTLETYGSIT